MNLRLPLVWGTGLFLLGLLLADRWPSLWFVAAAVLALVVQTLSLRHPRTSLCTAAFFWLMLGAGRMSLQRLWQDDARGPLSTLYQNISDNARLHAGRLVQRLQAQGLDEEPLALTAAMLMGQRSGLSRETRHEFSDAGTAHLLALSGMHLGVLYGLMQLLFLRWVRPTRWRWHALPLMLAAIWGYALLTGFPVSLVRASVMLSVMTIGSLAERGVPSLHTLSLAALVILLCSPDAVMDVGFQLSSLSVLFILTLYVPVQQRYHRLFSGWGLLLRPIGVSLAAQIGTAPLCLYYFHSLPLGAVAINLLMVPLTTAIIYLGVAALVWPATMLVSMLATVVNAELWLIKGWTALPHLTIHDIYVPRLMVVLLYALLLCAILRLHLQLKDDDFA